MNIGGFQKLSLLDYPNKISVIIWTAGCNLLCPFCYNKELFSKEINLIKEEEVLNFLKKRIGKIEALSISGGEPLLQDDILLFLKKVKNLNYLVKIDTNGTFPKKLKNIIDENLVDYISMDIKAPKNKYNTLCGKKVNINNIQKSIDIIINSSKEYEFKTTIIPNLLDKNDLIGIAKWIKGADRFYLQQFKNEIPLLSKEFEMIKPYSIEYLNEINKEIKPYFKKCSIRGV
jgi:pyruvate formate lyase activating enzyme